MFKGLSAFFENYSITATDSKNAALRPVDVSCGVESSFVKTSQLLKDLGYGSILENRDFREIFAKNENYEVTVSFISLPNSGTRIGAAVFSPNSRRAKRALIGLMTEISTAFVNEKI